MHFPLEDLLHDNKSVIVTAGKDRFINAWDCDSGEVVQQFERRSSCATNNLALSFDNSLLASADAGHAIQVWDMNTGILIHSLHGHTASIQVITFKGKLGSKEDPMKYLFASGGHDKVVMVWNLDPFAAMNRKQEEMISNDCRLYRALRGHHGCVKAIQFTNTIQLMTAADDGIIYIWNVETGEAVCKLTEQPSPAATINAMMNSAGDMVAIFGSDRIIRVWAREDEEGRMESLGNICIKGVGSSNNFLFTKNGKGVIVSSGDYTMRLYQFSTANGWEIKSEMKGHRNTIQGMTISHSGSNLASASADMTVRTWGIAHGTPLKTMTGYAECVNVLVYSNDDRLLFSASSRGRIIMWEAATGSMLRDFGGHKDAVHSILFIARNEPTMQELVQQEKLAMFSLIRELKRPPLQRSSAGTKLAAQFLSKVQFFGRFEWAVRHTVAQRIKAISLEKGIELFNHAQSESPVEGQFMFVVLLGTIKAQLKKTQDAAFKGPYRKFGTSGFRPVAADKDDQIATVTISPTEVLWSGKWIDMRTEGVSAIAETRAEVLVIPRLELAEIIRHHEKLEIDRMMDLELTSLGDLTVFSPLFQKLGEGILARFERVNSVTVANFPPSHVIYKIDQRGPQGIYVILKGEVIIWRPSKDMDPTSPIIGGWATVRKRLQEGSREADTLGCVPTAHLKKGDVFGGMSASSDGVFDGFTHLAKVFKGCQVIFFSATELLWACSSSAWGVILAHLDQQEISQIQHPIQQPSAKEVNLAQFWSRASQKHKGKRRPNNNNSNSYYAAPAAAPPPMQFPLEVKHRQWRRKVINRIRSFDPKPEKQKVKLSLPLLLPLATSRDDYHRRQRAESRSSTPDSLIEALTCIPNPPNAQPRITKLLLERRLSPLLKRDN